MGLERNSIHLISLSLIGVFLGLAILTCQASGDTMNDSDMVITETVLPPLENAMRMLDTLSLSPIEGIWEYPGEEVRVLIKRQHKDKPEIYTITILEAFSPKLQPGDKLGWITPCADNKKFELHQYTRRNRDILDMPGKCYAILGNNDRSILISPPDKISISFSPTYLLPKFWRMVGFRIKGNTKEPAEGLRKIYPSDVPGLLYQDIRIL